MKKTASETGTVINPGFTEILGTDAKEDYNKGFGKKYFEYRRKWNEYPRNGRVSDFPLHLDIESTSACNLRCIMCARNFMKEELENKLGYMKFGLFKKIIDEASEHGLPSIKLNYRGEPLLHPELERMVKYAKGAGVIEVQFNTNGLLLTEGRAKSLIEAGLDRIIFSFDGATKGTYEKIRTGSNYETVVSNIKTLVRLRDEMGLKRPCVRVQTVRMDETENEIDQYLDMWKPIANRVGIIKKRDRGGNTGKSKLKEFPCPQIWQRMMVCWDGEARMCCGDWGGMHVIGDANKESIYDIWHGQRLEHVRQCHLNGESGKIDVCAKCEINKKRHE
jgi:sulfatase maturation enzyme AslB (radical SAM superfamily)